MTSAPVVQTFRPTWEEFSEQTVEEYVTYMESKGAHYAGIAKIIPPSKWKPRQGDYESLEKMKHFRIVDPSYQIVVGNSGFYQLATVPENSMDLEEFAEMCESSKYRPPENTSYDELDALYWKEIKSSVPLYGAGMNGSLIDANCNVWNINRLNTIFDYVKKDYCEEILGVNTPYLYFGMWKTPFAWHTEDMDLYSINFLHFGAPKTWYAIPPQHGHLLEELARKKFPASHAVCPAFLRHKMTIISPDELRKAGIQFNKVTQEMNEIIITFPFGYHAGYNNGLNCAESTNFATQRWINYGKRVKRCNCEGAVNISMDTFVQRFQPHLYDSWLKGTDASFPKPSVQDVLINKNYSKSTLPEHVLERLFIEREQPPQAMPYKYRNPDVNIGEILQRNDLPKHIKDVFQNM